jgi:hypothetical protein
MTKKKWLVLVISTAAVFLLIAGLLTYVVDPFFQFRSRDEQYMIHQTYCSPGLIKTYDYDTILIGSSMSQNFDMDLFRSELGCNPLKIGIGGMSEDDQVEYIHLANRIGKADTYYLCIDISGYAAHSSPKTIKYLMKDDPLSRIQYALSYESWFRFLPVDLAFTAVTKTGRPLPASYENRIKIDRLGYWGDQYEYGEDIVLEGRESGAFRVSDIDTEDLYNRMKELLDSEKIYKIRSKNDEDARFGHKTPTKKFFGYKTHIAMSDDRIITGIEVTDGAQNDGKQLPKLIEKSKKNGVDVKEVVGDMAYVSDDNLEACEKEEVVLYAKTNSAVAAAANSELDEGFSYNKDARMLQCPAGNLAMRMDSQVAKSGNTHLKFVFSKKICKKCPLFEQCKINKGPEFSYCFTDPNEEHKARLNFENSDEFNKKLEVRHRIEEKNGEMKTTHGFRRADSVGLIAMRLQAYLTAVVVNMKRIVASIPV